MKLPTTLWEALEQGWNIDGAESKNSSDERVHWGVLELSRGKYDEYAAAEYLEIPFLAHYSYGKPKNYRNSQEEVAEALAKREIEERVQDKQFLKGCGVQAEKQGERS